MFSVLDSIGSRKNAAGVQNISSESIPFPPGFTLVDNISIGNEQVQKTKSSSPSHKQSQEFCSHVMVEQSQDTEVSRSDFNHVGNNEHMSSKGGSILEVLDDMIKVGKVMGYDMWGLSRINFTFPNRLNPDQVASLEMPIDSDEIRSAVWACGENKSPGPDGFTFEFFHRFWDVIGPDFCLAVKWFFVHNSFAKGCNYSFIALISKIMDPKIVEAGTFKGLKLNNSVTISHLFYADDVVFVGDWS
nr:RNA-directed DNA polymerase, eukaryota [Tanacetum cinerariifolium]